MKKIVLLFLLLNMGGACLATSNQHLRGSAELAAGALTIGLSIYNIKKCKKDWNELTKHPVKNLLFNREGISKLIKEFGVRTGIAAAAIFTIGLPLCYLGLFELLHKPIFHE